jgi:hypothetical protein
MLAGKKARKQRHVAFRTVAVGECFIPDGPPGAPAPGSSPRVYRKTTRIKADDGTWVRHFRPNYRVKLRACSRNEWRR